MRENDKSRFEFGEQFMRSIYRGLKSKQEIVALYNQQLSELNIPYRDIYIETVFGKTHVIECGNLDEKPLLVFHGAHATTTYHLKYCSFLLPYFHIYAVDTIGQPGKSGEAFLSPFNRDYGIWVKEIIRKLEYQQLACFGYSFGAGVLLKSMCVVPEMIERSVLLVPSGIKNTLPMKSITMVFSMCMYWITRKEKWFIQCMMPMVFSDKHITKEFFTTAKCCIDNAKMKVVMPRNAKKKEMKKYKNPVLVMAAEKDCLFPARKVIPKVKRAWPQCRTYLLKNRGHINKLSLVEKQMVIRALKK